MPAGRAGAVIRPGTGTTDWYPYFGVTPNVASLAGAGFASVTAAVEFFDAQTGGMTVFRTFSSGAIGSWTTSQVGAVTLNSNATVHHSFKTWDEAAITTWMNTKPNNGLDAFLTFNHEPENDGMTPAQIVTWQQRQSRLIELRNATGRTDIKCGPTLMDQFTLNPASGRNFWRDWYVGPPISGFTPVGYPTTYQTMDFYGWDPYNWNWDGTPPSYVDPATRILDSVYAIMDVHRAMSGMPVVIGEYGSPRIPSDLDGSGLAAWVTAYMQAGLNFDADESIRFLSVSYWSDGAGTGYDSSIHAEPLTLAAMSTFMAASRSFHGIAGV